jgi:SAM-dependent MidA family methyltransferase
MSALSDILHREIRHCGPIPFARFMDRALYCPELGYYDRFANTVGRAGDYFTSVSVGPLFGELLARQFADWLAAVPGEPRQLVEAGAHDGQLAHDLLAWLRRNRPDVWKRLEYWVLEPSTRRQQWQRQKLAEFAPQVRWLDAWERVAERAVRGVIFSNELLDAMPVHRLGWDAIAKRWFEWGVGLEGDQFVWRHLPRGSGGAFAVGVDEAAEVRSPLASLAPVNLPAELLAVLPDGFTTEVCPQAARWWTQAASRLGVGRLLTFDYGLRGEDFFTPERSKGTLRAYRAHRLCPDVLADPGAQDLTAHVNFSSLQTAGEAAGLRTEGCWPQGVFLTRLVQTDSAASAISTPAQARQFQTLTHPEHLGARFRVLVQSRSPPGSSPPLLRP